jgi:O-methyltransferase
VKDLPGDVCECGVGSGATSALLANELRSSGKKLWLYDTFAGLPAPTTEDTLINDIDGLGSMAAYKGLMAHGQDEARARLSLIGIPESDYVIVQGIFDQSVASQRLPDRVCFAYIDFDFYAPIQLALEVISARLAPGGIIVVDDYGFFSEGAQKAVDEFMAKNQHRFAIEVPDYCRDHFAILRSRQ